MNKRIFLQSVGAAALLCMGSVNLAQAHDADSGNINVRYAGDRTAKNVCMSIVYDDVRSLNKALKNRGSYYRSRTVHKTYECNQMPLNEFALAQNAEEASQYLAPLYGDDVGRVTIERVGSINQ